MKNLFVALLACAVLGTWSCQKDNSGIEDAMNDFGAKELNETFLGSAARYAASADSAIARACKGKWTQVEVSELDAGIVAYLAANYAGYEIKHSAKDNDGKVIVMVVSADGTVKAVLFNADGSFNREIARPGKNKFKISPVDIAALPTAVTAHIAGNYAGYTVKKAATLPEGEYLVAVAGESGIKILLYNADGTFNRELEKQVRRRK